MRAPALVVQPSARTGYVLGESSMPSGSASSVGRAETRRRDIGEASSESFEFEMPADRACLPGARRCVREWLDRGCGNAGALVEELELVVAELATNAVLYGVADPVVLAGRRSDGLVRLEVRDGCPSVPSRGEQDLLALGGRGLILVDALVEGLGGRWAFAVGVGVWVEVPISGARNDVSSLCGEA